MSLLVQAVHNRKNIRFIGDNLNFMQGVSQENVGNHVAHMFASCALVMDKCGEDLQDTPEIALENLSVSDVTLSPQEYAVIRQSWVMLIADVIRKYLPNLQAVRNCIPVDISTKESNSFNKKTEVYPLPVLPLNEQQYQDVVKILDHYEELIKHIKSQLEIEDMTVQVGDQLTRERFSSVMKLRLGNYNPQERLVNLGPTTFEFFHLGMNFLENMVFKSLWQDRGILEIGTLKCEKERIMRHNVNPDVMKAYDQDKDFFESYTNAFIIEATMEFFGMTGRNDAPTLNISPEFTDEEQETDWIQQKIGEIVDKYVFPCWSGSDQEKHDVADAVDKTEFATATLTNGQGIYSPIGKIHKETQTKKPDKIKDYSHHVLESGMTLRYFLLLQKTPDRKKMFGVLKMMMVQMKARNPKAKYPFEILRMLVQHYSLLPLKKSFQVFHACFVNTNGKTDGHVPADLQMEWIVKQQKEHIKHMFSNKAPEFIESKSSALPGIQSISNNFDNTCETVVRSKKHQRKEFSEDELNMMDDLRNVKSFHHQEGRSYESFKSIPRSQIKKLDGHKFNA